jgi:hypothetical protein
MSSEYRMEWESGARLERRAVHFIGSGTVALVLMAAIPAALGVLQQAVFGISTRAASVSGENAAATAFVLGNQPPKPALAENAGGMLGAEEACLRVALELSAQIPACASNVLPWLPQRSVDLQAY